MPHQDRLNIAVFIDFDNIEIGVKSTLGEHFDVGTILEALKERGEVVTKIAYADWTRAGEYSRHLTQHAIRLVQRNLTPGGDKNGADINLALDALEMAFTHQHINAYVIVGGDSDFLSLVEKLKQYDKKVFVVGGRAFTSVILQRNCHEFIAYENLRRTAPKTTGGRPQAPISSTPIAQAFPIVRRALKILSDREVSPQTGLLKSTLLQLDSTFSERNYGASSFLDFAEKLSKEGVVTLKHAGRSVMVELNAEHVDSGVTAEATPEAVPAEASAAPRQTETHGAPRQPEHGAPRPEPVVATESAAAGVARATRLLAAAKNARWPMYLRNVKQILRQADGGYDERRYGFGGLMDLLKALQREQVVRIERDRRGGLRVFQGNGLTRYVHDVPLEGLPQIDPALEAEMAEAQLTSVPVEMAEAADVDAIVEHEVEAIESEPMPIDTTAELLGRAKARKPRTPATSRLRSAPAPKRSAKKPAARRSSRKKAQSEAEETQD
ncbi:MAG TPA: NYN domain-containing protein [Vicinamibacterales bacterium]